VVNAEALANPLAKRAAPLVTKAAKELQEKKDLKKKRSNQNKIFIRSRNLSAP